MSKVHMLWWSILFSFYLIINKSHAVVQLSTPQRMRDLCKEEDYAFLNSQRDPDQSSQERHFSESQKTVEERVSFLDFSQKSN